MFSTQLIRYCYVRIGTFLHFTHFKHIMEVVYINECDSLVTYASDFHYINFSATVYLLNILLLVY